MKFFGAEYKFINHNLIDREQLRVIYHFYNTSIHQKRDPWVVVLIESSRLFGTIPNRLPWV